MVGIRMPEDTMGLFGIREGLSNLLNELGGGTDEPFGPCGQQEEAPAYTPPEPPREEPKYVAPVQLSEEEAQRSDEMRAREDDECALQAGPPKYDGVKDAVKGAINSLLGR